MTRLATPDTRRGTPQGEGSGPIGGYLSACGRYASTAAALGVLLCTASAFADSPRRAVQVLAVQSDDAVSDAQALTAALKNAVRQEPGVTLVPGDYSLEVLSLALGCSDPSPDDDCLAKIARKIKAESFVWGTLQRGARKLDLKLNLYRRGEPGRSTEARYDATNVDADALKQLAERSLSQLLSNEPKEQSGQLVINSDQVEAEIVVDGSPAGEIQDGVARLKLPVGEHDITVRADGYRDAEASVTISAAKQTLLQLHAERIGSPHSARPDADADADEPSGNDGVSPSVDTVPPALSDSNSNSNAGWAALALGTAFGIAGAYSTLRVNSVNHGADFDRYRSGIPQDEDACTAADQGVVVNGARSPGRISNLCTQAKTFEALQYVFFGLGAVAAGTGALILLTDGDSTEKHRTDSLRAKARREALVQPRFSVGPHEAAFDLRVRF